MRRPFWERILVLAAATLVGNSRWIIITCEMIFWWKDRQGSREADRRRLERDAVP